MSVTEHKATYQRIITVVNAADPDALDTLIAADLIDHNPVPDQAPGVVGFKQWLAAARHSFPDLHGTIEHLVAEDDLVAGHVTWRGTQQGSFAGVAPTGRPVAFAAHHIVRFADGKAAEWWGTADIAGAVAQLTALSASEREHV